MLDVMTQKSCAAYAFHRGRLGGNQTYFAQWQHFFVVPGQTARSFAGDNLVDPEGPLIRASIPPAVNPDAGPAADVVPEVAVDPVLAAAAARAEAAAAAAVRPAPSSSVRVVDKGKRKLVMKPRPAPPQGGEGIVLLFVSLLLLFFFFFFF
jgi:hypothetical protein